MTPHARQAHASNETRAYNPYQTLLSAARKRAERAAARVAAGKKPVQKVSRLGLGLTALTHRTADKVLQQQQRLVDNQIDAFAARLRAAAAATDLSNLVGTQLRLIPEQTSRLARDTRATVSIVIGAGGDAGKLLRDAIAEMSGTAPSAAPVGKKAGETASRRAVRKPAKTAKTAKTAKVTRRRTSKPAGTPSTS